ncbi:OmpA family protein [Sphingosinicella sp. LHD-64]|uniref:OmpA family protein n=1 Tax=Sphingosinicella sp. LHD-64 TaxID=3072139 RepID=UPI00280EB9BC|nr:OmpA family protein [Sphingosinicella sp. LHD-64]MDQ8756122.1 OmpA family protein [Sphingosinicella sp. LHD-64]
MSVISKNPAVLLLLAAVAGTAPGSLAAQPQDPPEADLSTTVSGPPSPDAAEMTQGPEIDGIVTSRSGDQVQVYTADGTSTTVAVNSDTRITSRGGFLGLGRTALAADSLLNGLPVSVATWQSGSGLVARRIDLKSRDLQTATMIRSGTAQQFAEQGSAIEQNAAATEALRGRMGSIDQYNVRSTTNVTFDFGRANLSEQAKADLCATAASAEATENALLLVVGYTDSTGSVEVNQALSERRAGSVVNYLQQACGWQPYRMLTPTGMAEADPAASNDTAEGQAQNRRVAVSVLVSKAVDGL